GPATRPPNASQRRRPRVRLDQHQRRLGDARPDAARPDELPERPEAHALVEELLDLMQRRLALAAIRFARLLLVERLDVGVRAARVGAFSGNGVGQTRRGAAV